VVLAVSAGDSATSPDLAALFAQQAHSEEPGGVTALPLIALKSFPHLVDGVAQPTAPPTRDNLFEPAVRIFLLGLVET